MIGRLPAPATILYLHSSAGLYGADVQLALIVRHLDRERYRAIAVLPFGGELEQELLDAGAEVRIRDLAVLRRQSLNPGGLARLALASRRDRLELATLASESGAALVHANTSVILGALPASRRAGIPLVQHVREIYGGAGPLWRSYRSRLERSEALVCVSVATARQFASARVIHDGVWRVVVPRERSEARAALGIAPDRFAVALLGRISAWKGQDVLARALAEAPLERIGAVGLIAGEPFPGEERHRERVVSLSAELGLGDRLKLIGFQRDLATLLGCVDAVCVPSTRPDPLPNSALEAAAAGRPVVAAAHGGAPEIFRDGVTGLLVEPGSHTALASRLAELAADPALASRIGSAAAAEIPSRFAPARMAAALQDVYDDLLTGSRPAS